MMESMDFKVIDKYIPCTIVGCNDKFNQLIACSMAHILNSIRPRIRSTVIECPLIFTADIEIDLGQIVVIRCTVKREVAGAACEIVCEADLIIVSIQGNAVK